MSQIRIHVLDMGDADATIVRQWGISPAGPWSHTTLIDAGTAERASDLVDACYRYAQGGIDTLVITHVDGDHVGGVPELLRQVTVRAGVMDDPAVLLRHFGPRLERASGPVKQRADCLIRGAEVVSAVRRQCPVHVPTPGTPINPAMWVLGPSTAFWTSCMNGAIPGRLDLDSPPFQPSLAPGLDDGDDDSFLNQSSVVLGAAPSAGLYLFTGDAGVAALLDVVERYPGLRAGVEWLKVPHHGGRRNLSTGLVRVLRPRTAYVSSCATSDDHPHDSVVSALVQVGSEVYATQGRHLWHDPGGVAVPGYEPATPLRPALPSPQPKIDFDLLSRLLAAPR